MTDFKAIETFMWVVTLGSFRGAAQKLNTTQPAISQRIAQLEREVGVKLLQRDRRMVLPTPSGRQLMVYAEKLIGLRSEMLAAVGDSLGLGTDKLTVHDLAKFPIITFPRKTPPYEVVRSLFNRPDLPPMRLHASASIATVIHMAIEGLGIAVIPTAIVETELAEGRLQLLSTNLQLPLLTFSASWLASPDTVAVERVAELAANLAQGGVIVDAPRQARH